MRVPPPFTLIAAFALVACAGAPATSPPTTSPTATASAAATMSPSATPTAVATQTAGPTATLGPTVTPGATPTQAVSPTAAGTPAVTEITCNASGSGEAVSIFEFGFGPTRVDAPNGVVTWTNDGQNTHTVTFDDGPDCGNVAPGASLTVALPAGGPYGYFCDIHGSMQGSVVVSE